MDVIGMTNLQEAKLAREAEICYVTIAMVTDYDCWHEEHDAVTVDQIIGNLTQNAENACKLVRHIVKTIPAGPHLQMRLRSETRDSHRYENRSARNQRPPGVVAWQVYRLANWRVKFWTPV